MIQLPSQFKERSREVVAPAEYDAFISSIDMEQPVSVRMNPYKKGEAPFCQERIPWCSEGYYLSSRPSFTLLPVFHGGAFYVQEASSMFLEQLFLQGIFPAIGKDIRVLDLCAAPGGKSTHIASLLGKEGLLVANEVIKPRSKILVENIQKWGTANTMVTNSDPRAFGNLCHFFDVMVVDAPCSGEGMFRKEPLAREEWSEDNVSLCAQRQRRILADAWDALAPGGFLIYSTCTFNREENEENIAWITRNYEVEPVEISLVSEWNVVRTETEGISAFRFFPHRIKGEGFFVTVMRKSSGERVERKNRAVGKGVFLSPAKNDMQELKNWFGHPGDWEFGVRNQEVYAFYNGRKADAEQIAAKVNLIYPGLDVGQLFHSKLKPAHALALCNDLSSSVVPVASLDEADALNYLRKADVGCEKFALSLNLIVYRGVSLGFLKRIGNRCNNMYPKEYRILNL